MLNRDQSMANASKTCFRHYLLDLARKQRLQRFYNLKAILLQMHEMLYFPLKT